MFRDADEELARLEAALMESEGEEETPSEEEEFFEEEEYEEEEKYLPDFDAYNNDTTDEDLEQFSETVYQGHKSGPLGLLAVVLVLLCLVLFALAWWLMKYGGFLG